MGLKGYRLRVMGQLDATCRAPHRLVGAFEPGRLSQRAGDGDARVVALQVAFEMQILKAVFHLIGFRLWI
jgi:hypothetical protein